MKATSAAPRVLTPALSPRGPLPSTSRAPPRPPPSYHSAKSPSRPFPSVSVTAGALGRAECRRCDSRVPGLPAPAAREQQAPGICSLLTGPRHAAAGLLQGEPGWICCTSFLLSGDWTKEGLKHLCPVPWRGELQRVSEALRACDGRRNKRLLTWLQPSDPAQDTSVCIHQLLHCYFTPYWMSK